MKKKAEVETLRDRLVSLMAENERLKETLHSNLPSVSVKDLLHADIQLPENIQRVIQQMIATEEKIEANSIVVKQRSFAIASPTTSDHGLVYVSPGFLALTGYSMEDCIGRNCRFLQGPETDKQEVKRMSEALKKQLDISVVLLNYRKDGSTFWNRIEIAHLRDEQNQVRFIVGVQNQVIPMIA